MTEALIPKLYQADSPLAVRSLLDGLDVEQLKPLAREFGGYRRINDDVPAAELRERILAGVSEKKAQVPVPVTLGATVTDEEDGSEHALTPELQARAAEALDRVRGGELAVQRGYLDICTGLRDFKACRGYLAHGYASWSAWCNAGRLQVFGQTRSKQWADTCIRIAENLPEELIAAGGQLIPFRSLIRVAQAVNSGAMELELERLTEGTVLTYTAPDGTERTLRIAQSPADIPDWQDFFAAVNAKLAEARAREDEARTEAHRVREDAAREAEELREDLRIKDGRIAELLGIDEKALGELLKKETGALTPEEAARIKAGHHAVVEDLRQTRAQATDLSKRLEAAAAELERRERSNAEIAAAAHVRTACETFRARWREAVSALEPVLAASDDLPPRSRDLLAAAIAEVEDELRNVYAAHAVQAPAEEQ